MQTLWISFPPLLLTAMSVVGCANFEVREQASCSNCGSSRVDAPANVAMATTSPYEIDGLWETDTGQKIRLADLRGKPRVFAMFFANCQGTCALTLEQLQSIEASLPAGRRSNVGFVMVTFDPAIDTAAKLAEYRASHGLSSNWTLLRGNAKMTEAIARHLNLTYTITPSHRLVHSNGITILDAKGKIANQQSGLHPDLNMVMAAINAGE